MIGCHQASVRVCGWTVTGGVCFLTCYRATHARIHRSSVLQVNFTQHRASYGYRANTIIIFIRSQKNQVAELWQKDRAKLETFSINVQRYSQNHIHNCIFGPPYVRIGRNVSGLFESFNARKLCSRVSWRAFLSQPLGGLTGNVCDSSLAGWKACSRLPINYNWIFFAISYGRNTNTSKSALLKRLCHFGAKY